MLVLEIINLTENLFQLNLEPGELSSSFQIPGQYVVISLENQKPIYMVIASNIGATNWSFLIRDANASTKILKELKVGDSISVSAAQGKGYPIEKLVNKNVILFSAGTGLAAFYSVIGKIISARQDFKKVILMHGSRLESELPYREEMIKWVENEIEVFVTLSQPEDSWAFYEGHVQEILKNEKLKLNTYSALICGPNQMMKDVTEAAESYGLLKNNIFTNY